MGPDKHPMGNPVEPRQWFVTFMPVERMAAGGAYLTIQVKADTEMAALAVAISTPDVMHKILEEGRQVARAVLVRAKHKPLTAVNIQVSLDG